MRLSYTTYTGDGNQTEFAIPFPYINANHIRVYQDNVLSNYTLINPTTVRLVSRLLPLASR